MPAKLLPVLALILTPALPVAADTFQRIDERAEFLDTVQGRQLRLGLFGITLEVKPDGKIEGRAMGWDVTGSWDWKDGYFCREMDWSGYPIPMNCQLVEARGDEQIRFTVDRGAGDSASFNLR